MPCIKSTKGAYQALTISASHPQKGPSESLRKGNLRKNCLLKLPFENIKSGSGENMCGLAGIIMQDPVALRAALPAMVNAQVHRGPDDEGSFVTAFGDSTLGLGFRRLAILDLTPSGHQPMIHPETGNTLVFNGEIYNFRALREELIAKGAKFRSQGDTEVLLQALVHWGEKALDRLAGMFALAYYDAQQQRLLLARDPLGIKPLYISNTNGLFVFASEVRSVLASGLVSKDISPTGIASYLAYGSVASPNIIFRNIQCFPAGSFQWVSPEVIRQSQKSPTRYWHFPRQREIRSNENICGTIRELIDQSVRDHLVSEVPTGVFLSAGIDSTIIANLAAKAKSQLQTFSVGFGDNPDIDESPVAKETARLIGSLHTEVRVSATDAKQSCIAWLNSLDRPSVDGLNTYIISKAVRNQGIVVALSGLGGDELFAGYSCFQTIPRLSRFVKTFQWVPPRFRSMLTHALTIRRSPAVTQKVIDMACSSGGLLDLYLFQRRVLSNQYMQMLGVDAQSLGLMHNFLREDVVNELQADLNDPVWTISSWESQLYLPNTLLFDSDLNGMAHSLEIRVPMLDRRVIDYVFSLPGPTRSPPRAASKILLRQAFKDCLRPQITARSKTGFRLPVEMWLKGSLRNLCEESLDYLKSQSLFRPQGIDEIWNRFQDRQDQWARSLSLCVLGYYLKRLEAIVPKRDRYSPISIPTAIPASHLRATILN